MQYLAILGRQPELSLVELESVVGSDQVTPFGQHALLTSLPDLTRLGGTLKLAQIIQESPQVDLDKIAIDPASLPAADGKTNFGVSFYGLGITPAKAKAFGLQLKKQLSGSWRLVAAKDDLALSAAQLKFNKIPQAGFELIIASDGQQLKIGLTAQVQNIDWYSERDFGRPARDASVGMLPPKLAQIMLNTAGGGLVVDPFCGTGVVLQEALLLGRSAQGSDLSPAMVESTRQNLEWLKSKVTHPLPTWSVATADAQDLKLPPDATIVSEGYLGINQPTEEQINQQIPELEQLYRAVLTNFAQQLKTGAEVTLAVPIWRKQSLSLIDQLPALGYNRKDFAHANSRSLIYWRPDASVGRHLLMLRKS